VTIRYRVSDGVCVLQLDSPPLNTITFELLEELRSALRRATKDAEAGGIVITGNSRHFSAGADINLFKRISGAEDAIRTSRVFQEAFQEIEDSPKPVVAALAGTVIGGALELALACHFRVATQDARLTFPEVNLGINPGSGGTQRLPRLIGLDAALGMLLRGERVSAQKALEMGLVDDICQSDQLMKRARNLLHCHPEPRKTSRLVDRLSDTEANKASIDKAGERVAKSRPEIIAPSKILDVVKTGMEESFQAGLAGEQQAFAECMETPATRNKIYLFFATRQTTKLPELSEAKPMPVAKAAVVGMGTMGAGIAHALMLNGLPVVVLDEDPLALDRGATRIGSSIEKRVADGKLAQRRADDMLSLLSTTSRWQDLADSDFVIESVFEDVGVKRSVLEQLEQVCGQQTVFATNTSTLSLDVLSALMRHPERLVGLHFFNPAHRMPLVEVIRRPDTPADVLATSLQLAKRLRKTPVVVANREGFVVTRVFVPYLQEAFQLLEEGAGAREIDAAAVGFGFPMGPLQLIDMAGLDILIHSHRVLERTFAWHGPLSPVAVGLFERGHHGQKTGSGVYWYDPGDRTPRQSRVTTELVAEARRETARPRRQISTEEITERLVLRMVSEAFWVMEEHVARCHSDVDVATVLGIGFPDFRGGAIKYAQDNGVSKTRQRLEQFAIQHGQRFRPCDALRE
jgi:3-hydroxyacyl-CoA dehydrogenase